MNFFSILANTMHDQERSSLRSAQNLHHETQLALTLLGLAHNGLTEQPLINRDQEIIDTNEPLFFTELGIIRLEYLALGNTRIAGRMEINFEGAAHNQGKNKKTWEALLNHPPENHATQLRKTLQLAIGEAFRLNILSREQHNAKYPQLKVLLPTNKVLVSIIPPTHLTPEQVIKAIFPNREITYAKEFVERNGMSSQTQVLTFHQGNHN
jgi:hypothetical protein